MKRRELFVFASLPFLGSTETHLGQAYKLLAGPVQAAVTSIVQVDELGGTPWEYLGYAAKCPGLCGGGA